MSTNSTVDGSEKFTADMWRRRRRDRRPLAEQLDEEHLVVLGLLQKQAEELFRENHKCYRAKQ